MSATELQDQSGGAAVVADGRDFGGSEARWQAAWGETGAYATPAEDTRESAYVFANCPPRSDELSLDQIRCYTISDAYARFRRARGDAVLFSLGFDGFGPVAESEASKREISPRAWVEESYAGVRRQFDRLGYSCDWDRGFVSSEPSHYRWTQRLFLAMLDEDLLYRRESRWFVRTSAYAQDNESGMDDLPGWSDVAIEAQRAELGRVDGVEVDAVVLGGGKLPVFTPHDDAIESAGFIAISPTHPEVDAFAAEPEVGERLREAEEAGWWLDEDGAGRGRVVQTGMQAAVPGAETLLPIVISPQVDGRFGSTAVLGIPERDEGDRAISETLETPPAGALKMTRASAKPRPAARYKLQDVPISRQRPWGAPVPLIQCEKCGAVPVPDDELPVRLPDDLEIGGDGNALAGRTDFIECDCPRCGGAARRESDTIDPYLDEMWMWMPVCVPAPDREASMFSHAEYQRWLPARQVVWSADAGGGMLDQRLVGKLLQDSGALPSQGAREPFASVLVQRTIRVGDSEVSERLGDVADPTSLVERVGADVVRLAVLHAAAPGRDFAWNDQPILHCQRFLAELWEYAEPRLREWEPPGDGVIDGSTKWRRRLAKWCRVAADKITGSLDRLEMQRATHNAILLLTRIRDFEARAETADGELDPADREAVVAALLIQLRLLSPFVPHITEELWEISGNSTLLAETSWPDLQ